TLHTFLKSAQETIYSYEGSINKLAVDDKGTIFIALFGAPPYAHEDDPERALRCALDLQKVAAEQGLQLAIGVTTGRVFTGPVGSETRREYTVMGDTVNLAARLMGQAGLGGIRCDHESYRVTRTRLDFKVLDPVALKGKTGLIRLYEPLGKSVTGQYTASDLSTLIGRREEVAAFTADLDRVEAGNSRILVIEGEAGIGKSRLIEELRRQVEGRGLISLLGTARSIEQHTPYRAWRDIFNTFFALNDLDSQASKQQTVARRVQDATPDLVERLPLLNDMLNLNFPENALTHSMEPELRQESLVSLLLALLRGWAEERPLILILEDAHWLDSLSWDLTLQAARALTVARVPLYLVVVTRPLVGEAMRMEPALLAAMDQTEHLSLESLSPAETVALAAIRLGLTRDRLPAAVAELVRERAGGNPFFAEELVYTLRDNGLITITYENDRKVCLVSGDLDQAVQTFPDTVQGLVLSRIDRLPPEEQLTLKVAAVIGRTFSYPALYDILQEYAELGERMLKVYLDDLRSLDLTPLEVPEPELTYIFKHIITQEVAYETLLFSQRRQLHRSVGEWFHTYFGGQSIEHPPKMGLSHTFDSPLAAFYPLLAHHWGQAEDAVWERHYQWLAGHRAAAQFANEDAINYFSRALALTPETDIEARYDLLLAREKVNDLRGRREAQAADLAALEALALAENNRWWQARIAIRRA
ncbi:MAG: BREX system ATP-binding domain-containing protein, partial [Anaerolineae bacterium]|nr:BREX system ATP-binding domain-containing protein [Anaerolineae bacterium]